jgi:hypothetical protein
LKTTHQLVQKYIAHSASLATDPLRFSSEVIKTTRRMAERISADPALLAFTSHLAQSLCQAFAQATSFNPAFREPLTFARADSLISGFSGELVMGFAILELFGGKDNRNGRSAPPNV